MTSISGASISKSMNIERTDYLGLCLVVLLLWVLHSSYDFGFMNFFNTMYFAILTLFLSFLFRWVFFDLLFGIKSNAIWKRNFFYSFFR